MVKDAELERFKALNLAELAVSYGYALEPRESSRSSLVMSHIDSDKIIIATSEDGHGIFFSVKTSASGSVIDFVRHRRGGNLGHARQTLRAYNPPPFPTAHAPAISKPFPIARDRAALAVHWHQLPPYTGGYLESRRLNAATLAAFADRIRTDERGNTVFRHDDREGLTGWEAKNRGFTGFAAGGKKALFAVRVGIAPAAHPPRLVIAESAIDAMSYYQHDPAPALVLSFSGGWSAQQVALLRQVLTQYPAAEIVIATDADAEGDRYAASIQTVRPGAVRARPLTGKDWNETLQASPTAALTPLEPRRKPVGAFLGVPKGGNPTQATQNRPDGLQKRSRGV